MDCCQDEVSGLCGPQSYLGGFFVANFSDAYYVWVLAEHASQAFGKGDVGFWIYFNLARLRQDLFDGVFDSDDVSSVEVYLV